MAGTSARYVIEQGCLSGSAWKACEPFLAVLGSNVLPPDIKILAIEVYRKLLLASVELTTRDRSHAKALSAIQTCGNPRTALLAALEADDNELQLAALTCLATLFQNLLENAFLDNADEQVAAARFLKFATHPERRFHVPMLSIIDSISRYAHGRAFLRGTRASEALRDMIVEISTVAGGLAPEEAALVGSNAALICKSFCRVEFAKEQPLARSDESALSKAVVFPAIDAMVALLRRDVSGALVASETAPVTTAASQPPSAAVPSSLARLPSDTCAVVITSLGRMVQVSEKCKARANEQGVLPVLLDCLKIAGDDDLHQVADKLMHLCILLPGNGDSHRLNVNPRILSVRDDVADLSSSDSSGSEQAQNPPNEGPPFLPVESVVALLDLPSPPGDKRLLFRVVRWLAALVVCPKNAQVLGESRAESFLRLLLETSPQNDLLFGFLAKAAARARYGDCDCARCLAQGSRRFDGVGCELNALRAAMCG
ncbi:hypothetical protein PybrP1_012548 [[Pythium] brassicae (nom. inval.)]|nr:hypothetical protein PybrP1_012548 [[Pythium] brassicae (nom. inval.)]